MSSATVTESRGSASFQSFWSLFCEQFTIWSNSYLDYYSIPLHHCPRFLEPELVGYRVVSFTKSEIFCLKVDISFHRRRKMHSTTHVLIVYFTFEKSSNAWSNGVVMMKIFDFEYRGKIWCGFGASSGGPLTIW